MYYSKELKTGETIGVVREDGKAAVFMPADEAEFLRIHTTDNNDGIIDVFGTIALLVNAHCL